MDAVQLAPAHIKAFALSEGKRAKTDRIDAELVARFMAFRPEAGRRYAVLQDSARRRANMPPWSSRHR